MPISKWRAATGLRRLSSSSWPHTWRKMIGELACVAHRCLNAGYVRSHSSHSARTPGSTCSRVGIGSNGIGASSRSSIFGAMTIDTERTRAFVQRAWDAEIIPALTDYIRIPAKSPMYDTKWAENGHIDRAVTLITDWARARKIEGLTLEVVRLLGRTPVILMEVPGPADDTVVLYGHLDKQPEMEGWAAAAARGRRSSRATVSTGAALRTTGTPRSPPHRHRGGPRQAGAALAVHRADRGQRGIGIAGPAGLRRGARHPHRPTEPRGVPRFRLRRLRPDVGHDVVARSRQRRPVGRHRHRGPSFRGRQRHRAVDLSHPSISCSAGLRTRGPVASLVDECDVEIPPARVAEARAVARGWETTSSRSGRSSTA